MIDFSARLMMLLLTTALVSGVTPERTWAQETPPPAETESVSETASSPAQNISDKEIDSLAEQLRTGTAPEALAKLDALATLENRRALHLLGDLYAKGPLPIDGAKAVDYYARAVAAGEHNDLIRLADLYRDGKLITTDPAKALGYYRQAADLGNATGQLRLGGTLIRGTLGETDPAQGLALLEALAEKDNRWALYDLGELYSKGPLPVDGTKAVGYYERALAAGHDAVLPRLGDLYRDGALVKADPAKALDYYRQAAALGNATGQLRLGSALIKGTLGQPDLAQGLTLLDALAEKDNINALQELGELYSKGPLPVDGTKAVNYYERAVAAGEIGTLVRLGDLYRDGNVVTADPAKAVEYYQKAINQGNSAAQLRLGSALIKGTLGDPDPAKGLTLLEGLAAQQNRWALNELGELYSKGPLPIDGAKAIDYYSRAVEAGNTSTLLRLGGLYRDGTLVKADPARAIAFYEEAYASGQSAGLRNLAVSHTERRFGRLSQPAKGVKLLQDALKAGDMNAATALANVYFNGTTVAKDPQRGLQVLRQAAEAGNPSAARSLISVLRNGKGRELPRNLAKADAAMQKYAALFTQTDLELEQVLLSAARADSPKEFAAVAAAMKEASPALQQRMLTMVRGSNQNAYAWLLQERLAELGLYKGRLNGIMNTATIRAVSAFCAQQDLRADCVQGPLHWTTARVLAANLYN